MAELLLRSPVSIGSVRNVPILGEWFHKLSHRLVRQEEKVWTCIRQGPANGIWLELNPRTGWDYARGHAESAVQQVLAERLRPGMVFYDLGANIGLFSLLAARLVTEQGRVLSFEPDSETAARLRRNIEKNGFQNIQIMEAGVGATTGHSVFLAAEANSPDRGVGRFALQGETAPGELVQRFALDDFIRDFPTPDAIKCDVEGAELEVFRGAQRTLAERRPWTVFEFHSAANGSSLRGLCRSIGYTLHDVDENHLLALP